MSNVNISLSANTSQYVKRLKEAKTETDRNIIRMEKRIDTFSKEVVSELTTVSGAFNKINSAIGSIKYGGYVLAATAVVGACVGMVKSLANVGLQSAKTSKDIAVAAEQMKMNASQLGDVTAAVGSVGISMEKYAAISKNVHKQMGNYLSSGTGAFKEFFESVQKGSDITVDSLRNLQSIDVLKKMVHEMEVTGTSYEKMVSVMESFGKDASKILPMLLNGAKEYDRAVTLYARNQTQMLDATIEKIQSMDASTQTATANLKTLLTEEFRDVISMYDKIMNYAHKKLDEATVNAQKENIIEDLLNGNSRGGTFTNIEALEYYLSLLKETPKQLEVMKVTTKALGTNTLAPVPRGAITSRLEYLDSYKEVYKEELKLLEKERDLMKARGELSKSNHTPIKDNSDTGKIKELDLENKTLSDNLKSIEESAKKANEQAAELRKTLNQPNSTLTPTERDAIKEQIALYKQASDNYKATIEDINKKIEQNNNEKIALERKAGKDLLDIKVELAKEGADKIKAIQAAELHDHETQLKQKKINQDVYNAKVAQSNKKAAEALINHSKQKLREAYNLDVKRITSSAAFTTDANKKLKAQHDLDALNLKLSLDSKEITQAEYNERKAFLDVKHGDDSIKTALDESIKILKVQESLSTSKRVQAQLDHAMAIQELQKTKKEVGFIESEYNLKLEELTRNHKQNLLLIDAEYTATQFEADAIRRAVELEKITSDYESDLISHEGFLARKAELDSQEAQAEVELESQKIGMMSEMADTIAGMAEEGSQAQKLAFAAQKGFAIAEAMLMIESNALKAKAAAMAASPGAGAVAAGETAAMLSRVKDGVSIAAMTATAIGQFHSGTDEVDQTGSYILKQGERVVQESANKDLTAYLQNNRKNSNSSTIKSDLIIQGDTTISDEKFQAMLFQHRESLTQSMKAAQRENPSLR
ncbi:hypothetical protein [Vibrio parahaemolyticus]|uniref:hypothetical protein n=1 Tax=Vibrio parahaemolyticus TaxID=670 RepID=UPI0005F1A2E9|nr:hypothetical protein [Vibrio parahaemolyticus]KJR15235.1 hypothetical protein UF28_16345 [Vibrio parahaemolyticus]